MTSQAARDFCAYLGPVDTMISPANNTLYAILRGGLADAMLRLKCHGRVKGDSLSRERTFLCCQTHCDSPPAVV